MKLLYELFDDFEEIKTKKERIEFLQKNMNPVMSLVFQLAYDPKYQWTVKELPNNYRVPTDVLPGIAFESLNRQLRKMYIFQKDNPNTKTLTEDKRNQILLEMLESIEPREAEVILGIFQKDLGVKGLTPGLIQEACPGILNF